MSAEIALEPAASDRTPHDACAAERDEPRDRPEPLDSSPHLPSGANARVGQDSVALLGVVVALLLVLPLVRMWMPLSIDFGEGWNTYMADALNRGEPIYAPAESLTRNNYPPLSFYAVAWLGRATGWSSLLVGRVASVIALLIVALEIGWAAGALGASRPAAWFGALVFLGLVAAASSRYVAMDDPQLLAHAVMELALVAYVLWPVERYPYVVPLLAVLMAVGLLTKHNLVALPIALTLHVGLVARPVLVPWCAALGGAVGGLVALLNWQTGGLLVQNMLTPRRYSIETLVDVSRVAWLAMLVPVAVATAILWRRRADARLLLVALYFAVAVVLGSVFSGGSGADVNMFFSAFVALSVGIALAMTAVESLRGALRAATIAMIAWLACALPVRALTPVSYHAMRQRAADSVADVQFLRTRNGPAYCEQMLLCYWAHKPLILQPYFAPELIAAGLTPESAVARLFATRVFGTLQLDQPVENESHRSSPAPWPRRRTPARLPAGLLRVIARHYRLARTSSNGVFYVPIEPDASATLETPDVRVEVSRDRNHNAHLLAGRGR